MTQFFVIYISFIILHLYSFDLSVMWLYMCQYVRIRQYRKYFWARIMALVIDIDKCFYKSFSNISKCSWFAYQKNPYFGLLCIIGDISYLTEKDVKIYEAWMCILVGKIETVSVSLNCKQHIWHMNELVRILKSSFNLL